MATNIIQKEKERQDEYLTALKEWTHRGMTQGQSYAEERIASHKQSLINLKEYMERIKILVFNNFLYTSEKITQKDIEELKSMIKIYGNKN